MVFDVALAMWVTVFGFVYYYTNEPVRAARNGEAMWTFNGRPNPTLMRLTFAN